MLIIKRFAANSLLRIYLSNICGRLYLGRCVLAKGSLWALAHLFIHSLIVYHFGRGEI